MLVMLLSILVLLFSWTAAHIAAIPVVHLAHLTHLERIPALQVFLPHTDRQAILQVRRLIFAGTLIVLSAFLAAVLGIEPVHLLWKGYIQNFVDFGLTQTVLSGLLDNIVLSFGIFLVVQIITLINEFFPRLYNMLDTWRRTRFHVIRLGSLELITPDQVTNAARSLVRYVQVGLNLILGFLGFSFFLSFFPGTQIVVLALFGRFFAMLAGLGQTVLGYLPNLLTLLVIWLATRYLLKFMRFLDDGVRSNQIKIIGLHQELAEPTFQLMRFLIVALALVTAYPFLPGSDSPVFRGITIFVGFLLSLGSTSLVTNIVSGVVLTYTRGLRIGDRVRIGDTTGDVIERTLLVTRIRTIKNVVITIPNGMVLSSEIVNYSAPMIPEALILHTTVTIGYDVPWRVVHDLLIRAAAAARDILEEPAPFVLQTSLDDYYVSYELNAYTRSPERMAQIYSELHQNIQDRFNDAGVEILSPAYAAHRDGSDAAVAPALPSDSPSIPAMLLGRISRGFASSSRRR